jgi:hypothetical protein
MSMPSAISGNFHNPVKRTAVAWWVLCVLSLFGIFAPHLFGVDAMQWGFGISFLCLVFGITAIFVAVMYTKRGKLVEQMLRKENLLAHWTYTPAEWQYYAQKEHGQNKREKRNLFLLVAAISIVIGLILSVIHPDGRLVFLLTVVGIIGIAGGAALLSIWPRYRQNRKHLGEVYISQDGVYLNKELHVWRGFGAALEEVSYQDQYRAQPLLHIVYSMPNRYNRQQVTVRVPVPQGEQAAAKNVADQLQAQLKEGSPLPHRKSKSNEVI